MAFFSVKNFGVTEFKRLFLQPRPWLDVRAPVEFAAGAVPGAINIPLLTDSERHDVGLIYKQQGQAAAIELGHTLVRGEVKEQRIRAWLDAGAADAEPVIYCFRGGLRSQTVQKWLSERGLELPLIEGGYKSLRRFLLGSLESELPRMRFQVVSGPTGSGKTPFLKSHGAPFLDLEGLAKHRGSAFGALEGVRQPSQGDFENALAVELLKLSSSVGDQVILVENESRMIGRLAIPEPLFSKMKQSPKLELDVPFEQRVENIFKDYILNSSLAVGRSPHRFADFEKSIQSISKKLGGQDAKEILADLATARLDFESGRGLGSNRVWIAKLLKRYYDPLYGGQSEGRSGKS